MKKNVLWVAALVVVLASGVVVFGNHSKNGSQTTDAAVADLFGQKYNRSADSVNVAVSTDTGKFAKGSVSFEGENGGGLWFAAKTSGGWELAYDGNGIVPCDAANQYGFPADMIPSCLDSQNQLVER